MRRISTIASWNSLLLFRKIVIVQDLVMVENGYDIVRTRDSSEAAGFLEVNWAIKVSTVNCVENSV